MPLEIALAELALHQLLMDIEGHAVVGSQRHFRARLVAEGVAEEQGGRLVLSAAGAELRRSLQHKLAADREAMRLAAKRDGSAEPAGYSLGDSPAEGS